MNKGIKAWINGFSGVAIFSGTLPATRLAVTSFDPVFLTFARASIAGSIAVVLLIVLRQPSPARSDHGSLLLVSLGVVIGFPLFTALALTHVSSAHAIIFVGLLPLTTTLFGMLHGSERPRPVFWIFSVSGSLGVILFAFMQGIQISMLDDILMLAAIILCGFGYAEGTRLSRRLGGWQVICWVLAFSLPVMLPLCLWMMPDNFHQATWQAMLGLGYVSVFSMLLGFIFWYRGLALGGIANISQLQLLQPFLGLGLATVLLNEPINPAMLACASLVAFCVFGARHSK